MPRGRVDLEQVRKIYNKYVQKWRRTPLKCMGGGLVRFYTYLLLNEKKHVPIVSCCWLFRFCFLFVFGSIEITGPALLAGATLTFCLHSHAYIRGEIPGLSSYRNSAKTACSPRLAPVFMYQVCYCGAPAYFVSIRADDILPGFRGWIQIHVMREQLLAHLQICVCMYAADYRLITPTCG